MENRQQQILSEIQSMISSVRSQLEKLDAKLTEFQQSVDPEGVASMPIDIEIDMQVLESVSESVQESVQQELPEVAPEVEAAPEVDVLPEIEAAPEVEVAPEPVAVSELEPVIENTVDDLPEDLPLFSDPEPVMAMPEQASILEAAQKSPKAFKAVVDVMEDKQAWRTDMPGAPVRDILSAISLNDRVQFINVLFKADPAAFQQARARINTMQTLDEVVDYVTSEFDWDMNSQVVYRFMMAARRKVQ